MRSRVLADTVPALRRAPAGTGVDGFKIPRAEARRVFLRRLVDE